MGDLSARRGHDIGLPFPCMPQMTSMITYFRESAMPDSPDTKIHHTSPKSASASSLPPVTRPLSSSSSISGINGNHSPLSTLNGRTPSPPMVGSLMNSSMGQQLPPACGARQLSKLKRFLTTLQQFGSDISPEIGERVRSLVLGLVNSHLSIEEFHGKLQEATNFPLRPFVIPFLKANLPLLQRELLHCARMAKQSPQQFLTQNEHIVFDPAHSPLDSRESLAPEMISDSRKRSSPDRPKENTLDLHLEGPTFPAKRHHGSHPISPVSSSRVSPGSTFNFSTGGPIRLEDISKSRELRERERMEREQMERERADRDRERHFSSYSYRSTEPLDQLERLDEDWRHVETMLNCIMGMVDKTKRAMAVLQERSIRDREELALWSRRQTDSVESDTKKRSPSDSLSFTLRQTEDRVTEVRRRAEEAVNDVKRQAMLELQKAMSAADQKAMDLLAAERSKMERTISEARKQTQEEMLRSYSHQEESIESCWNCGRKASETCSGCNVARYCGSFCQHKDWENHHHVCGKAHITTVAEAREQRRLALASAAAAVAAASTTPTPFTSATSSMPMSVSATNSSSSSSSSSLSSSSSASAPTVAAVAAKGLQDTPAVCSANSPSLPLSSSSLKTSTTSSTSALASLSPAPSVVPNLSSKDAVPVPIPAPATLIPAPSPASSSSPRSLNPTDSNPNSPVQEVESAGKVLSPTEPSSL